MAESGVVTGSNRKTDGTGVFPGSDYYRSRCVFREICNVARESACGLFDRGEGEGGGEEEHGFSKLNRPILAIGLTNPGIFFCDSCPTNRLCLRQNQSSFALFLLKPD